MVITLERALFRCLVSFNQMTASGDSVRQLFYTVVRMMRATDLDTMGKLPIHTPKGWILTISYPKLHFHIP